jgi:hypothetical protein
MDWIDLAQDRDQWRALVNSETRKLSKKAESQLLLPVADLKAQWKRVSQFLSKHQKGQRRNIL